MDAAKIKNLIPMRDLVRRLGFEPNRSGYISCPFHDEKTASCWIPDKPNGGWHCFGCGKGGDQIDFIRELTNCSFSEALRVLAGLAGVTLTTSRRRNRHETAKRIAEQRRKQELREHLRWMLECRVDEAWRNLIRIERLIEQRKQIKSMDELTDDMINADTDYEQALIWLDRVEYEQRLLS